MANPTAMLMTAIFVTVEVKDSAPAPVSFWEIYLETFTCLIKLQASGYQLQVPGSFRVVNLGNGEQRLLDILFGYTDLSYHLQLAACRYQLN